MIPLFSSADPIKIQMKRLWGRHPSAITPDWGAQRVKGLSIRALIADLFRKPFGGKDTGHVEMSLIESFRYPKFGPGQLWETTAAEVERMGGKLVHHACVDKLRVENGSSVGVEAGGRFYGGDIVLSSMPLKDLVAGMNAVPQDIRAIADGLPYRDSITVGILVNRLALRNETKLLTLNNIIPDC